MNRLCAKLLPEDKSSVTRVSFVYKGASVSEESGELILWYMGPIIRPKINAGYRAQWVYDLKKGCLTSVYLSVVPLE